MPEDKPQNIFYRVPGMKRRGAQTFRLGDTVRILSGPFAAFNGRVEGINQEKRLLKVKVEVFGRETPVKLCFDDAQVVSFS